LSPYPCAWCIIKNNGEEWSVKLFEAKIITENHTLKIGQIITSKQDIKVAVKDGFIQIVSLQLPGKKKMLTKELLNGITFSEKAQAE
jgi:methionyl-tRNA formyltransferase